MEKVEGLPPGTIIAPEVTAEIKKLQAELYERLKRYMKGNPLRVHIPAPTKKELEFIKHKKITREQIEEAVALKIIFHFSVFSSLNVRIGQFKVEAFTKEEAWLEARKKSREYPGKVTLKIS